MAQYQAGTVSVTNGSTTVTGAGTLFTTAGIAAGDLFYADGDLVVYPIAAVPSQTSLTLSGAYGGTTRAGIAYGVTVDFTPISGLPLIADGDLGAAALYNEAMRILDAI